MGTEEGKKELAAFDNSEATISILTSLEDSKTFHFFLRRIFGGKNTSARLQNVNRILVLLITFMLAYLLYLIIIISC